MATGCQNLFNLMGGNYNYFEGITVRNTNVAFLLGIKGIAGASGFTLKRSKIYDVGRAVQDDWSGSKNFYIADNTFIGRHDPNKMMGWTGALWEKFPGFPELLTSEYAIKVYGQGHVVAYNYIANWHDAIDVATYGDAGRRSERHSGSRSRCRSTSTATTSSTWATTASRPTAARATSACSATAASTRPPAR